MLREAARALRTEADASRGRRDETRARVMRSLKAQRARRLAMVRVVVPLAAVLVGSVAWASAARWFPGGWDDVASRLGLRVSEAPAYSPAPPPHRVLSGPRHAAEAPAPPEAEAPAPPAAEASAEAVAPEQPRCLRRRGAPIAPAPPRAPVLAVAPVRSASRQVAAVAPSVARLPAAPRPAAGDPQGHRAPAGRPRRGRALSGGAPRALRRAQPGGRARRVERVPRRRPARPLRDGGPVQPRPLPGTPRPRGRGAAGARAVRAGRLRRLPPGRVALAARGDARRGRVNVAARERTRRERAQHGR